VEGSSEYGDEPSGSGATELVQLVPKSGLIGKQCRTVTPVVA
jgi:hypothetical protein